MPSVDLAAINNISKELENLSVPSALAGGSILGFLLDNPHLVRLRPTDDVDAIVNVVTLADHTSLDNQLRKLGFINDISEDAPICRWIFKGIKVDIMPLNDPTGTLSNQWFEYALKTASPKTLNTITTRTISATCFLATKLEAFHNRGNEDYFASHDLEDLLTLIDGRESLLKELENEELKLRDYVSGTFQRLLQQRGFIEALPGHLEPDSASQQRLSQLLNRLNSIANITIA